MSHYSHNTHYSCNTHHYNILFQELSIPEDHDEMLIDLRHFMNLSPYTCIESVSFARLFNLFRSMGLRHLVVVNENNKVVGIVTRKDLAKFRKWRKQGSSGVQQLSFINDTNCNNECFD